MKNYDLNKQEIFFKNFISVLEDLYIIGNEDKRNKILAYQINDEEDEHIDEWNKNYKEANKNKEEKREEDEKKDENMDNN